ncbi:MAG: bca [Haloplasmataceae bacterium]|jgi:phosphatidylglycerophosphatase A|nr:bca [Haloplasmataceae bacterium]
MKLSKLRVFILFIFLFTFFIKTNNVHASVVNSCETDKLAPIITGVKEWNLLLGQEMPDFSIYILIEDNCEPEPTLNIITNYININVEGSYPLTYIATDSNSNVSRATVNVNVKEDITPPEFIGLKNFEREVFSNLTSEDFLDGVTANDLFDGDITHKIIVDYSKVNPNVVGNYEVIFIVSDANSNSVTKKVTLNIVDRTKPNFTLISQPIEVLTKSVNWLDYIVVEDNYDLNPNISVTYAVNLNKIGRYTVVYNIKDKYGNENEAVLEVNVVDTSVPVINIDNYEIEVFSNEVNWSEIVEVTDNYDQNPRILYDSLEVNYIKIGTYNVIYTVIDSSNNTTEKTILVYVVDKVNPTIKNLTNFNILIGSSKPNWIENILVEDNYDHIITNEKVIVDDKNVNLNLEGIYQLTYSVMDSSGNSTIETVLVRVYDNVFPVFSDLHDFNIATKSNNVDFMTGVTATDNLNGDISSHIFYDDKNITYDKVGVYQLRYFVSDLSGNITEAFVNVFVNYDLQKPIIFGLSNKTLEINTMLDDWLEGVYFVDDYDQELQIDVDLSKLDISKTGNYIVTYNVLDDAGNKGSESITVKIADTFKPVITGLIDKTVEINTELNLLSGLIVTDNSGEILVIHVDSKVEMNKLGIYIVNYNVSDSSNNKVIETITITVVDTTKPNITGTMDKTVEINSDYYPLDGLNVTDNSGEVLVISVDSTVVINKLGNYTVTYSTIDSSGNSIVETITVTVVDTSKPVINGVSDKEIKKGKTFSPLAGISATDNDSDITNNIIVTGEYNSKIVGEYLITLTVSDESGNKTSTSFTLVVNPNNSSIIILSIIFISLILIGTAFYFLNKKYKWINFNHIYKKIFIKNKNNV